MRPIVHSGLSQGAHGWFWWTIDDVGFYDARPDAVSTSRPLGNPWRAAWTRAKHLRRAADSLRRISHASDEGTYDERWFSEVRAYQRAKWSLVYRAAASRADWVTRP